MFVPKPLHSDLMLSAEKLTQKQTRTYSRVKLQQETDWSGICFFYHISHAEGKIPYRSSQAANSRVRKVLLYFLKSPRGSRFLPVHILLKDITVCCCAETVTIRCNLSVALRPFQTCLPQEFNRFLTCLQGESLSSSYVPGSSCVQAFQQKKIYSMFVLKPPPDIW